MRKKSYTAQETGEFLICLVEDYFPQSVLQYVVKQPLTLLGVEAKYDVIVNVFGGGFTGQANAIRLGVARALLQADPDSRPALKKEGNRTRSSYSRWNGQHRYQ